MRIDYVQKGILISGKHNEIKDVKLGRRINCLDGECHFISNEEISEDIISRVHEGLEG